MKYITSFSPQGYEQYGRDFLISYTKHMATPLTVYVEAPCDFKHPSVTYKNLLKTEGCSEFLAKAGAFDICHGHIMGHPQRDYTRDVYKFCRKSFAQIDAASQNGDWLIWLDSDMVINAPFPRPKGDSCIYYLGRPKWKSSCTSYIAWNLKHPKSAEFFKNYWMLYVTGTCLTQPQWDDAYLFDQVREQCRIPSVNLAEHLIDQMKPGDPVNVFDMVFPNAHHKKGNLKLAKTA